MPELSLTLPLEMWGLAVLAILMGASTLQESGVRFGRKTSWEAFAVSGSLILVAVFVAMGYGIAVENNILPGGVK